MRTLAAVLSIVTTWAGAGVAEESKLQPLATGEEAAPWESVGRLDLGRGFCTGSLIAPDLVLTAAHCLYDRRTSSVLDPARIEFRAGFRQGSSSASRGVRRAVPHPAYRFNPEAGLEESIYDLALLELDQPIQDAEVAPLEIDSEKAGTGQSVSVVSYAIGRSEVPSREEACDVIREDRGVFILSCNVDFGASGAPVFRMDGSIARIVSVVSAKARLQGRRVALGASIAEPLAELRAVLYAVNREAFLAR